MKHRLPNQQDCEIIGVVCGRLSDSKRDVRTARSFVRVVFCALVLMGSVYATDKIELIGIGEFPGTATDRSGQCDSLENGEPHNRLGGFSALEYTGNGHRYAALADRGPDDGATGYLCRYQVIDITVQPDVVPVVKLELVDSVLLHDHEGRPFTGDASAFDPAQRPGERLDPEGFRFARDGGFYVSDEYGPQLIRFSPVGQETCRLPLPAHLQIAHPADSKLKENQLNVTGRSSNKGMEGLAISRDGKRLFGIMQNVLLQDGRRTDGSVPEGVNCRLIELELRTGNVREFVYQLDQPANGLNEIVAIGNDQFLVIERDGAVGKDAGFKKIMKVDLVGATEVQDIESLPPGDLPDSIRPVSKEVFVDFLSPAYEIVPAQIPEKIEGLTLGPRLADGRHTLIVASDNDFEPLFPSLIYVFALPPNSIPLQPGSDSEASLGTPDRCR